MVKHFAHTCSPSLLVRPRQEDQESGSAGLQDLFKASLNNDLSQKQEAKTKMGETGAVAQCTCLKFRWP